MKDLQKTLKREYIFEGKGLHTGLKVNMTLAPAPADTGVVFFRTDLGENARVEALVDYVTQTQRARSGLRPCVWPRLVPRSFSAGGSFSDGGGGQQDLRVPTDSGSQWRARG